MRPADLRRFCLTLPAATETVQWGECHVFKVGGKMFALIRMVGRSFDGLSFKVSPGSFHILTREPGIVPAPYLARAGWVALDRLDRLPRRPAQGLHRPGPHSDRGEAAQEGAGSAGSNGKDAGADQTG